MAAELPSIHIGRFQDVGFLSQDRRFRIFNLEYPYIQEIEKELFDLIWKAIKENNHSEIRRLKMENPELTIYSGFFYYPDGKSKTYLKGREFMEKGEIVNLLCLLTKQFPNSSEFPEYSDDKWENTYSTYRLLFDLGFIERDDSYFIFEFLNSSDFIRVEMASDFLSSLMDVSSICRSLFYYGLSEFDSEIFSWGLLLENVKRNFVRPLTDTIDADEMEILHKMNEALRILNLYLIDDNEFEKYESEDDK